MTKPKAVDTCLAKLLAETSEIEQLIELLHSPNDCLLNEVEPFVDAEKHPYALCQILRLAGEKERVLELLVQ